MNSQEYIDQELQKIADKLSQQIANSMESAENNLNFVHRRIDKLDKKVSLIDNLIKEFAVFMGKL